MSSFKKILVLAGSFMVVSFLCLPALAQAQATAPEAPARQEYTGGGLVNCGHSIQDPCRLQDIFVLVARVTNWLIAIAGVYAVFQIIAAGFWLVVSMGNEEAITQKKKSLSNSIIGFILAMMAFLFVNTAANYILHSKCRLDLTNPLSYLTIQNYDKADPSTGKCQ